MSLNNVCFILVRPQMGENIGSVARAIKNFNIKNLRIVKPRCNWPNQKALATSVGAKDILRSSTIYNSIEKAIGDMDIVFASTSRIRKVNKKIISILDINKKIKNKRKIGIIFGPEASGPKIIPIFFPFLIFVFKFETEIIFLLTFLILELLARIMSRSSIDFSTEL